MYLHLTDGRSFKGKHQLLDTAQRSQMTAELQKHPDAIHLVASGIVVHSSTGERWSGYPDDYQWLLKMAATYRIVVMSGDVHRNRIPEPTATPGGRNLFEITSSGASIGTLVALGPQLHNFGLVEIEQDTIHLTTYHEARGKQDHERTIDIASWT